MLGLPSTSLPLLLSNAGSTKLRAASLFVRNGRVSNLTDTEDNTISVSKGESTRWAPLVFPEHLLSIAEVHRDRVAVNASFRSLIPLSCLLRVVI